MSTVLSSEGSRGQANTYNPWYTWWKDIKLRNEFRSGETTSIPNRVEKDKPDKNVIFMGHFINNLEFFENISDMKYYLYNVSVSVFL